MSPAKRFLAAVLGLMAVACFIGLIVVNVHANQNQNPEPVFGNIFPWGTIAPTCPTPTPKPTCQPTNTIPAQTHCPTQEPTTVPTPCPTEKAPELRPQIEDAPIGGGPVEEGHDTDRFQLTPPPRS